MPVQLYRDILAAIREGRIKKGSKLPSSRKAAESLGVSRTTVNAAYELLRAEGVLSVRQGAVPAIHVPEWPVKSETSSFSHDLSKRGQGICKDLRRNSFVADQGRMSPGVPDEALFPAQEWARLSRQMARRKHGALSAYGSPYGAPALRAVLAERLFTDRGITVSPDQILVTTGTQASLSLIAQVMTDPGECAAVEDPCHLGARTAFLGAGLTVAPVPVDDDGLDPDLLPDQTRLIYITPSNQYPLGCRLSLSRRMMLLEKARSMQAMVLEDDYDSEFLWRGKEIAALTAHAAGEEVIYLSSASKVLLPGLRVGWMAVPERLVGPFRAAIRNIGIMANVHAQLVLADMMRSGLYRGQLRRISRIYENRGKALFQALSCNDAVEVKEPDGGVQLAVRFHAGGRETDALTALAHHGFRPARLSTHSLSGTMEGLIVGFADANENTIRKFCSVLEQVLKQ